MTRREFATLVYLAKHPFWVFSAGQLYEEVWGGW
ncbi:MAG: winged helix-turn-helix domain-containing protein [Clostridium fessum]